MLLVKQENKGWPSFVQLLVSVLYVSLLFIFLPPEDVQRLFQSRILLCYREKGKYHPSWNQAWEGAIDQAGYMTKLWSTNKILQTPLWTPPLTRNRPFHRSNLKGWPNIIINYWLLCFYQSNVTMWRIRATFVTPFVKRSIHSSQHYSYSATKKPNTRTYRYVHPQTCSPLSLWADTYQCVCLLQTVCQPTSRNSAVVVVVAFTVFFATNRTR